MGPPSSSGVILKELLLLQPFSALGLSDKAMAHVLRETLSAEEQE